MDFLERLGSVTTFESDVTTNINVADASDYSFNTTNSVAVAMSERLSIKVSLQFLYENKPALKKDLDVIARVDLIDPDGIHGTGDELFETVVDGGTPIVIGSADTRRNKLDTIFRTAVVISF